MFFVKKQYQQHANNSSIGSTAGKLLPNGGITVVPIIISCKYLLSFSEIQFSDMKVDRVKVRVRAAVGNASNGVTASVADDG